MDSEKEIKELKKIIGKLEKRIAKLEEIFKFRSPEVRKEEVEVPDKLLDQAIEIVSRYDRASASLIQRRLSIGYARAARILDQMEARGFIGPATGSMPREVLHKEK